MAQRVDLSELNEWADTLRLVQSAATPLVGTAFHDALSRLLETILGASERVLEVNTRVLAELIGDALDDFDGSVPLEDFLAGRLTAAMVDGIV